MPLVSKLQKCQNVLVGKYEGFDYSNITVFMHNKELIQLLKPTQSERAQECIRYAVYKASGVSPSAAYRLFGLRT